MMRDVIVNVTGPPSNALLQSPPHGNDILVAVAVVLSFFSVVGAVGNAMVLYVYVRKRNKLASTVFIITLACTDFVTCVVIIPYTIILEYYKYYIKYDAMCKLYMFLITSNVPFSAFIMMAIAFDRYLCICHPFTHILTTSRAKMVITVLGFIAFSLGIITALNYGVYFWSSDSSVPNVTSSDSIEGWTTFSIKDVDIEVFRDDLEIARYNASDINHSDLSDLSLKPDKYLRYEGFCIPNGLIFSHQFTETYQKIYSSFFMVVIVTVVVLYVMIYRFVSLRRARRRRMRFQQNGYSSSKDTAYSFVQTRTAVVNGYVKTEVDTDSTDIFEDHAKLEKTELNQQMTIREKGMVANIRTASMLFVVTAVFVIAFLPAWLMAHMVIPYNMLIFYMYFVYNVANPLIYAFMNKAFRRDLKDVVICT